MQSRFEKFSEPLIQKMAVNEAENQQLASLRDWLLPMLMNGQVTSTSSVTGKQTDSSDDSKSSDE